MENGFQVSLKLRNNRNYDGNTIKFGITVPYKSDSGVYKKHYIVKFPEQNISSIFSEYVASRVIQQLGFNVHRVWIGYFNNSEVNIIEDFTSTQEKLHSFKDTRQSSEGTDLSDKTYTYQDVLDLIKKNTKMSDEHKNLMTTQFWQMFICDAILANRDRHPGNWGYLKTPKGNVPAPIYDNGGSLFPDVSRVIGQFNRDTRKKFLFERAEYFPASLFQIKDTQGKPRRSNYYEMFKDLRVNKRLAKETKDFKSRIGYSGICQAACTVLSEQSVRQLIPYIYRKFYFDIIRLRYLHIIERMPLEDAFKKMG